MKTDVRVLLYLAQFFLERENFQTNAVGKMKTRIVCSVSFFKNRAIYEIIFWKYGTARQATDENVAHALCVVGK